MGKRSDGFERSPNDYYPTPREAVEPLLPYLAAGTVFYEPCAGDFSLAQHLIDAGHQWVGASDILPMKPFVERRDALSLEEDDLGSATVFITNPPWDTRLMHPILDHLVTLRPAWILMYGDWLFTKQAIPFIPKATVVVPIGRIKWIPGSPHTGKDNACWVHFTGVNELGGPILYPRCP